MRQFILLAFISILLTRYVTPLKIHEYPNLAWLFSINDKSNDSKQEARTVCQTQECKKMANVMLENMNKSVDPCDDFYEYACGNWPKCNPIPNGVSKWNAFYKLQTDIYSQVKDILSNGFKDKDLFVTQIAKRWYESCIDTDAMDERGLDPLISTISRIGGWPMVMDADEWDEREYMWQKVDDYYMRLTGRNTFHEVRIRQDILNKSQKVVHIDTPHLPPGVNKLRSEIPLDSDEEGDESDEDSSDEEDYSQEPGSEGEDDSKDEDYYDYDYGSGDSREFGSGDDDDSEDDEDYGYQNDHGSGDSDDYSGDRDDNDDIDHGSGYDNDDDDTDGASGDRDNHNDNGEGNGNGHDDNDDGSDYTYIDIDNNDNDANGQIGNSNKKVDKRKINSKIIYRRKSERNRQEKNVIHITKKHNSHQVKRQKEKRRVMPIKVESKQRFTRGEKINARENKRDHTKRVRTERRRRAFDNVETISSTLREKKNDKRETTMTREKYANYISMVARILAEERGTKVSQECLDKDIKDMIDFQLNLLKIIPNPTSVSSLQLDLELTLDDFQEWYDNKKSRTANSEIDWIYKIEELFDEAHVIVNEDLNLEVGSSNYFKDLVSLLDKTSSRTIVNYIHWNFISKIIKTTTNEMRKLYYSWENEKPSPRWFICAKSEGIKHILAYEFVGKYFSDDIVETALGMLDDIQKEVEYLIKESDWMDDEAKDFALAKLMYMRKLVGYPDWYRNSTIVKRYLQGLMVGKSYYENSLSYRRYIKWKELRKLEENATGILSVDPTVVNAFFIPWKNALTVAAADFQSPFFAYNRPQSINFGIIGFIMAHEVNHGFDSRGHMFNKDGDYMGWLSAMAKSYGKKAECFVKQFNNYSIDETSSQKIQNYGNQTVKDNIADTMGLQAIFKAYQRSESERGKTDPALPGMEEFTNNQLFFLSFANLWCEAIKPDYLISSAKKDIHSTGHLRVIGSVSNSEDFAKAYNCPIGSPMNPEKKCNIWK